MITRPSGMSFLDWSSQIQTDLDSYGSIGRADTFAAWQDWAAQLMNITTLSRALPDPYAFSEWRDWAERLCGALS